MSHTIPEVAADANALFTALAADLNIDLSLPSLDLVTDFNPPPATGDAYDTIPSITVEQLTSGVVDGTGVFDVMMKAVTAHLDLQSTKNRITGADYAKVYLGAIQSVMQYGSSFLLGKDQARWQSLQSQAAVRLAQAQEVKALADIQIARATIRQMQFEAATSQLKAYTARNEYADTKMGLIKTYNGILASEVEVELVTEQVDTARAQTKDTLKDGTTVQGIVGQDRILKEAQAQTALENLDLARAQTKDTLLNGGPIMGIAAVDKAYKEAQQVQMLKQGELTTEQVETARAQTRDTLSTGVAVSGLLGVEKQIKLAQKGLTEEQHDTQRAQTKETLLSGLPVEGIAKHEKLLKSAQAKLVDEQYESQRGQTKGTLSNGQTIVGLIGAQTKLYEQQIISYKRDGESKGLKMLLDTWTARKTIDDGVAVPANIDTPAINTAIQTYMNNLQL